MSKTKRIALIDADIILWRACMTAEYTVYIDPDQNVAWRYKKLVPEEVRDRLISINVINSPEMAIDAFRSMMLNTINNTNATHAILFLSPKTTFRHRAAKTLEYKGNRKERAKPVYHELLTQMMINQYGAIVCDDIEADDGLGIMQSHYSKENVSSVICSIDKDLKMIPGDHYNLTSFAQEIITPAKANMQFAIQLLTGDATDNIQGLTRVGIKTAEKILKDVGPKERVEVIKEKYKKQFKEKADARFKENIKLLKILRKVPEGQKIAFYDKPTDCLKFDLTMASGNGATDGFTVQ